MAVQLMPCSFRSSAQQVQQQRLAVGHSAAEKHFVNRQQPGQLTACGGSTVVAPITTRSPDRSAMMARSCLHHSCSVDGEEQIPRYENLDVLGQALPEDLLETQFSEIQPAYVTLLQGASQGENTASVATDEERPPAPLPNERNFLDDLVIQKLQSVKEAPPVDVQRRLGYEDTKPRLPQAPSASRSPGRAQRPSTAQKPSPKVSSRASPKLPKEAPRPKPRVSVPSESLSSSKSRGVSNGAPVVSSSITPPQASIMTSGNTGRQLLKLDGVPTEWFHGVITRKEADGLLKDQPVGTFLVRIGERHLGYSLSVRGGAGMKHFMITQRDENEFQLGTNPKIHASMHDLISHFYQNDLNSSGDMLTEGFNHATAMY
eukprot:scpid55054/ scgid16511/ Hematopoietic SH2 domain-containing protein; Adaptor in lymphocytes of unknown function X